MLEDILRKNNILKQTSSNLTIISDYALMDTSGSSCLSPDASEQSRRCSILFQTKTAEFVIWYISGVQWYIILSVAFSCTSLLCEIHFHSMIIMNLFDLWHYSKPFCWKVSYQSNAQISCFPYSFITLSIFVVTSTLYCSQIIVIIFNFIWKGKWHAKGLEFFPSPVSPKGVVNSETSVKRRNSSAWNTIRYLHYLTEYGKPIFLLFSQIPLWNSFWDQ